MYILVKIFILYFDIRINGFYETYCIDTINCVRWHQNGERLASTCLDGTVKVLDFASGKVTYTGETVEGGKSFVVHKFDLLLVIRTSHVNMFPLKKAA